MAGQTILVDLNRCVGCWSCAMACKMGNHLDVDEYRMSVRTLGSGGIDEPSGTFPDLHMSWLPVWSKKCTRCPDRQAEGDLPYCVLSCPAHALYLGDVDDPASEAGKKREELTARGFRAYELDEWEDTHANVLYLTPGK
ncbi:MAG: hypothetical protein SOI38_02925 [Eggerthellaceae bacterium]|jgi:Fe-S-cluster-containing dehydrogenase component